MMKRDGVEMSRLDPETLAALLDGTLPAEERAAAIDILARSDADFEVMADAAKALEDLEGGGGANASPASADPDHADRDASLTEPEDRWVPGWKLWLPLAAAVVGIVFLPRLLRDSELDTLWGDFGVVAARTGPRLESALGPAWETPGWTAVRGTDIVLNSAQRAYRAGAQLAALAVAVRAGDAEAGDRSRSRLVELLEPVEGGGLATAALRDWLTPTNGGEPGPGAWARTVRAMESVSGSGDWFRLGLWTERSRLAVLAGATELVYSEGAASDLERLAGHLPAAERERIRTSLDEVLRLLDREPAERDPVALRGALERLAREAGG